MILRPHHLALMITLTVSVLLPVTADAWTVTAVVGDPQVRDARSGGWGSLKTGMSLTDSQEIDVGTLDEVTVRNEAGRDVRLRALYRVELGRAVASLLPLRKRFVPRQMITPVTVSGVRGEDASAPRATATLPDQEIAHQYEKPVDLWNALNTAIENGDGATWSGLFTEEMYEDTEIVEFLAAAKEIVAGSDSFIEAYARRLDHLPAPELRMAREMLPLFVSNFCDAVNVGDADADFRYRLIDDRKDQIIGLPRYFKAAVKKEAEHRTHLIHIYTYDYEKENNVVFPHDTDLSPLAARGIPPATLKDPWGKMYHIEHGDTPIRVHWINTTMPSGEKISEGWGVLEATQWRVEEEQRALEECVRAFRDDHDRWPTAEEGLAAACETEAMRLDPWGKPYSYKQEGDSFIISTIMSNDHEVILRARPYLKKVIGIGASVTPHGVTFKLRSSGSDPVYLSGSFDNWENYAHPMISVDGNWEITIALPPGIHQYKFHSNGQWFPDPNNPKTEPDGQGGNNSVVEVMP